MNHHLFLLCFSVILWSGCLKAQELTTYELKEVSNILYYIDGSITDKEAQLNLILPEGVENAPVLIWIGQGAWAYVNKDQEMGICRKMAERGIVVVSAGHRLSPALLGGPPRHEGVQHPAHVKDIAMAFKWVYDHAEEYNYDLNNIFIGGFSSGAHLAALLAMDKRYLESLGLSTTMIRGIIPVGGGFDIPHYREDLLKEDPSYDKNHIIPVFGETHKQHLDASPTTYIDDLITPILLISEGDTYVYNKVFEELLVEKGYDKFEVLNLHNQTHAGLWRAMAADEGEVYRAYIVSFIRRLSK
jgi:hypothetical protein